MFSLGMNLGAMVNHVGSGDGLPTKIELESQFCHSLAGVTLYRLLTSLSFSFLTYKIWLKLSTFLELLRTK